MKETTRPTSWKRRWTEAAIAASILIAAMAAEDALGSPEQDEASAHSHQCMVEVIHAIGEEVKTTAADEHLIDRTRGMLDTCAMSAQEERAYLETLTYSHCAHDGCGQWGARIARTRDALEEAMKR